MGGTRDRHPCREREGDYSSHPVTDLYLYIYIYTHIISLNNIITYHFCIHIKFCFLLENEFPSPPVQFQEQQPVGMGKKKGMGWGRFESNK